jgi:Fe-S cluster assembly ATP-binding protein
MLTINCSVSVKDKKILDNVSLSVKPGTIHVVMGPNGAGKSTLSHAVMGDDRYTVEGSIKMDGDELTSLPMDERARKGLFMSFQYPVEIPGLSMKKFLRAAYKSVHGDITVMDFKKVYDAASKNLGVHTKYVNDGASGGQKKRNEMLQLKVLNPKYALLDETDSGLDVDALKVVAQTVKDAVQDGCGVLLVTHYLKFLEYLQPDDVTVIVNGKVVEQGDIKLAQKIEVEGYSGY